MKAVFKSLADMLQVLSDEEKCKAYLEYVLWDNNPTCPHCKQLNPYKLKSKGVFKGLYKCSGCKQRYTVTVGTVFEGSHIPLRKWMITWYIETSHKKGISSHQLAKDLGITQKSAWFLLHRIRESMKESPDMLSGVIQADETFVGGKNANRHKDKKVEKCQGRSFKDKTPVLGLIDDAGRVKTIVIPNTKAETIQPLVREFVSPGSTLYTDEWCAYSNMQKDYAHSFVDHRRKQYVNGECTTNKVENLWSHLKRGFVTYHHLSPKHLQRYCNTISFRQNNRKLTPQECFDIALRQSKTTLTYKQLTQ